MNMDGFRVVHTEGKNNGLLINIDSQAPNKIAAEWLATQNYTTVIPEYTYGDSRIDFYMEQGDTKCLMEIKGHRWHPGFAKPLS